MGGFPLKTIVPVLALALALVAVPAAAEECVPTTSDPEFDSADLGGTGVGLPAHGPRYYVDNDPCQPQCLFSTWAYEESNGIDGLQRGDEVKDDTCGGMIESDGFSGF